MPASIVRSFFCGTLFATAFCLSCAASSEPSGDPASTKDSLLRCGEIIAPEAEEQQGLRAVSCASRAEEDDRSYLLATASPGATMVLQGPEIAIARLNPEFVARLASAIRQARDSGLPVAGIFSAYRPPGFGVGGFADKFKSLHAYGLAVDMSGIGEPGSKKAKLWHDIAGQHGIFCPYGFESKAEWNHCQATPIKIASSASSLRKTITAEGPIQLEEMFKVGDAVIAGSMAASGIAVAANQPNQSNVMRPDVVRAALRSEHLDRKPWHQARHGPGSAFARAAQRDKAQRLAMAIDMRHLEKFRRKPAVESKTQNSRKAARAPAAHRGLTHRRSHLA